MGSLTLKVFPSLIFLLNANINIVLKVINLAWLFYQCKTAWEVFVPECRCLPQVPEDRNSLWSDEEIWTKYGKEILLFNILIYSLYLYTIGCFPYEDKTN